MRIRDTIRLVLVFLAILLTAPLWILCQIQKRICHGRSWFSTCSEFLSMAPGVVGIYLRRGFYCRTLDSYDLTSSVGFGTTIAHIEVRIGKSVYIGNKCTIGCANIANYCTIGSNVDILSGRHQHNYSDIDSPIQNQGGHFQQVQIGKNCWIGNSAVIMADIGDDCVIGAGAVVVKSIPALSVAVGNPAVIKKTRTPQQLDPAYIMENT